MKAERIKMGITKIKQDRKQEEEAKEKDASGAAKEKALTDGGDVPGSLSDEQVFDLAGGARPGNPEPPH